MTKLRAGAAPRRKSIFREYAEILLLAGALTMLVRTSVAQAFRIPTGSMEQTLLVGDFLFVNKFLYGAPIPATHAHLPALRAPRRGDVVVFRYPRDPRQDYIKRLIGQPGDTLQIRDKIVWINGHPLDESYVQFVDARIRPAGWPEPGIEPPEAGNRDNFGPVVVPPGHYFMMGDNRDNSADSRYWGFLEARLIEGPAEVIYWSWDMEHRFAGVLPTPRLGRLGRIIR